MKMPANTLWIIVAFILGGLVGAFVSDDTPSYPRLVASRDRAMQMSPRIENMEVWMRANRLPTKQQPGHLHKRTLVDHGLSDAGLDETTTCIYFSELPVRGGFFARHVAYGYFFFSKDGSLIDYVMYDIYYGM